MGSLDKSSSSECGCRCQSYPKKTVMKFLDEFKYYPGNIYIRMTVHNVLLKHLQFSNSLHRSLSYLYV